MRRNFEIQVNFLGLNVAKFYNESVEWYLYKDSRGFSLIDILIGTMVSFIIISICYSVMFFQINQLRSIRGLYVQNVVLAHIKFAVSSKNIKDSGTDPENVELRNCLTGVDDINCKAAKIYPLRLHDGGLVAGFEADPVNYNTDAQKCTAGSENCLFKLSTEFRVQCAEDPGNPFYVPSKCPGTPPGIVEVFYKFSPIKDDDASRIIGAKSINGSVIVGM
jgi:hypothetical protein